MKKSLKRPLFSFTILSYIIFNVILGLTGLAIALGVSTNITKLAQVIGAWSSTFAFLILFKRIYPEVTLKEFVKKQFRNKIKFTTLSLVILIPVLIFGINYLLMPKTDSNSPFLYTNVGMLIVWFFFNLSSGPLGEELGWRGYVLNELQKKYSTLKSALIVGILWGFWHAPLWLIGGLDGVSCLLFMVAIISFSVVLSYLYQHSRNLVIPILLHQLFNFLTSLIKADVRDVYLYTAICYAAVALLFVAYHKLMGVKKQAITSIKNIHQAV